MKVNICFIAGLLACALLSCKKDKAVTVDDKNLTGCPTGATCQTLFTESADLNTNWGFKTGNYRLFWYTQTKSIATATLYIKAPMAGNSFELKADDIRAGLVTWKFNCPTCDYVNLNPTGGYIKGVNTTPNVPADKSKWLLEAQVFLASGTSPNVKDTINLKQYFSPNFVYN